MNSRRKPRFLGAVSLSIFIALILMLVPLPDWLNIWRPEWIALAIIYWSFILPRHMGFLLAWVIGLLMDVLTGSLLGLHALGYVMTLFLTRYVCMRMNERNWIQQTVLMLVVLALYLLLKLWISGATGNPLQNQWLYWAPLLSSLAIWPLYRSFLHLFHIREQVY